MACYWYAKMCTLIKYKICESLVKISNEWSSNYGWKFLKTKELDWLNNKCLHRVTFHFYLNIQFVKVWWSYIVSNMYNIWKIPKKYNLIREFSITSSLACWPSKMYTLIRDRICESLLKIRYFRHEYSTIMYENSQKTQ